MMNRSQIPMIALAVMTFAAATFALPASATAAVGRSDVEAENFVKDFSAKMILIVSNKNRPLAKRYEDIRKLLSNNVDKRRIGIFMLGRYARKVKRSELQAYIDLMENYAMRVFIGRLLAAKNAHTAKIKVLKSTKKGSSGKEAIVFTQLSVKSIEQPIQVRWWVVRNKNNVIKIFNIGVEGFWLAQEQRAIFISLIQKNKGDPKALLRYLRQRIKQSEQRSSLKDKKK